MSDFQDKFVLLFFWLTVFSLFFLVGSCIHKESTITEAEHQRRMDLNSCNSKVQGSRPFCWKERDWKEYCKRVQCKSHTKE